jgi:hypothetical protein
VWQPLVPRRGEAEKIATKAGKARPLRDSVVIAARRRGVRTAGWSTPEQHARFGLLKAPALGLFGPVVVSTQRGEIAFAGDPALIPGDRMVQVTASRGAAAAWSGTGRAASSDQVGQLAAGVVPDLRMSMVAGTACDGGHADGQAGRVRAARGPGAGRRVPAR